MVKISKHTEKYIKVCLQVCILFALTGCISSASMQIDYNFNLEIKGNRPSLHGRPIVMTCQKSNFDFGYGLYKKAIEQNKLCLYILPEDLLDKRDAYMIAAPKGFEFSGWEDFNTIMRDYLHYRSREALAESAISVLLLRESSSCYCESDRHVVREAMDCALEAMFIYDRYPGFLLIKDTENIPRRCFLYNSRGGAPTMIGMLDSGVEHYYFTEEGELTGTFKLVLPWNYYILNGDNGLFGAEILQEVMNLFWRLYCDDFANDRKVSGHAIYDRKEKKCKLSFTIDEN